MKKLFATLALGSLAILGCDQPSSSKPKSAPTTPPAGVSAAEKGHMEGQKQAEAAAAAAKKAAEDAKKGTDDKKNGDKK